MSRKRNHYLRILAVQEAYQAEKIHEGITDSWIYAHVIFPRFHISRRTLSRYLSTNAKRELNKIEAKCEQ